MKRSILVIDDNQDQARGLAKILATKLPDCYFFYKYKEDEILDSIENDFFSLAILDIRMDDYKYDGIELLKQIKEKNPFSKVILVSAYSNEYYKEINDALQTGIVEAIQEKNDLDIWSNDLKEIIEKYYSKLEAENSSEINNALLENYAMIKNEKDAYKKGNRLEHFISLLFQSIGFNHIQKRVIDKSRNEVDLIIRNEIDDSFLNKFGKYILIECKNKPKEGVGKNDFIVFEKKLRNTTSLSELGILITTGYIGRNTYLEAMRESNKNFKILFLDNPLIEKLIKSNNKLETFKSIIDSQVKDN